jgi:alkylation response protein AidB-like acyl-CoA dehydrogenase
MFATTSDQELFEAATVRFLEEHYPIERVRSLARSGVAFEPDVWKRGAELGWTTLLVPEAAGGGSMTGNGVADLLILAYQFGLHAVPGPLFGTNAVAAALGRWGTPDHHAGALARLIAGDVVAAWMHPTDESAVVASRAGDEVVLQGAVTHVEAAADAAHLLVAARDGDGWSQYLLDADTPGIEVTPLDGIDLTRRFHRVELRDVTVPPGALVGAAGDAGDDIGWLRDLVCALQLGAMTGAMQWAFDTTLEWTFNRYSFGRPLGSYQEIKHRVADMKMHLEASEAIAASAAAAVGRDDPDRSSLVSAGKFYVGRHGPEMLQDCIQLHGGIGVTFEHDLHIFLRRAVTDSQLSGSPGAHAARLTDLVERAEVLR